MKKRISIRYMVELFLTLLLILFMAATLVQMFVFARGKSVHASHLTDAVMLSENIAEVLSGTKGRSEQIEALGKMRTAAKVEEEDGEIRITMQPEPYLAIIRSSSENAPMGMEYREIYIYETGTRKELFHLSTGERTGGRE